METLELNNEEIIYLKELFKKYIELLMTMLK